VARPPSWACCAAASPESAFRAWTEETGILQLATLPAPALIQWLGGLLLLLFGAELAVRAAVDLAAILRIRPLLIGLTVVALGSSAPQLAVSLQAAFSSNTDIAVGSVIGGSIFNVLVTLGLCALIVPLRVARQVLRIDIPLMIAACLLVTGLAWDRELGKLDGALLLAGLAACLVVVLRQGGHIARHGHTVGSEAPRASSRLTMLVGGLLTLALGGHLLVDASVVIALNLGLSERIIGLTVIAIATSLPGLMTSVIAALRGERDMAVGNVIGSNLLNLLGVLGLTAMVAPDSLSVSPNALIFDLPVLLGVAALCLPVLYSGYRIDRVEGLLFLSLYLTYGLHIVSISTGMLLAERLESAMLRLILPVLAVLVTWGIVRAWRRQH
jgi:cation:H+ antiporter